MWKRLWTNCYCLKNKTAYPHLYKNWDKTLPLCGQSFVPIPDLLSLVYKRLTVRTFLLCRVCLMCANLDSVQGTVVFFLVMERTVLDGTFNALVFAIYLHGKTSFKFDWITCLLSAQDVYKRQVCRCFRFGIQNRAAYLRHVPSPHRCSACTSACS